MTEDISSVSSDIQVRDNPTEVSRIALGIEYNGKDFHGWQRQRKPEVATVQSSLEHALAQVATLPIQVHCAGRTDAGVHGAGQVVHFDAAVERPLKAWVHGVNTFLPPSIRVLWAQAVAGEFHARHSALSRRYQYWIINTPVASALIAGGVTHYPFPLDAAAMHNAAQALLGEQDFSAFRAASCESRTPMRNVQRVTVSRHDDFICVDIQANAFLLHMVRNIVGSLLEVGSQRRPERWIAELLNGRDRKQAAPTAKPDGLYLYRVEYPDQYQLPRDLSRIPLR